MFELGKCCASPWTSDPRAATLDGMTSTRDLTRRGFLLSGLAGALTVTAAGTTGLLVSARPSRAADSLVIDVMGDYEIVDRQTGCRVRVTVRDGIRRIVANGLPNHATGQFPNSHNPNAISAQSYDISLPASPRKASASTAYSIPQPFGIALNGVVFDPYAAEWWGGARNGDWQYNALGDGIDLGLDSSHAHVQPTGAYHYHGMPDGLIDTLSSSRHSPLIGWAGDGFPIYLPRGYRKAKDPTSGLKTLRSSYILRSGTRPSGPGGTYDGTFEQDYRYKKGAGNLDKANGRTQVTPEYPAGTYCYILTRSWPVIPRRFVAEIAPSFVTRPGPGPGGPPR
jgi:hypothetical protein